MSALTRRANPNAPVIMVVTAIGVVVAIIAMVSIAGWAGNIIQPFTVPEIDGMSSFVDAASTGQWPWNVPATIVLALELVIVTAVILGIFRATREWRNRSLVDRAARYMAVGRELEPISDKAAAETAGRLGTEPGFVGLPLGQSVLGKRDLFSSVEELVLAIFGPRMGKTTSLAIPWILAAPGPMLATSNKRDLWDDTRDYCGLRGRAWCFDLQGIAEEKPTWFYDPLSYVTDSVSAEQLAEHFASGSSAGLGPADRYFDPAAQLLNAGLFLAAAVAGHSIMMVLTWLTNIDKLAPDAVAILAGAGFDRVADDLEATLHITNKQRDGIVGTASQMVSCLRNDSVVPWVTREGLFDTRPQFNPHEFVRSRDSIFLLSKEGVGTATPLVTALTAAIVEAAEKYATTQPGGRLATPFVGVLDEAANVCRWQRLPDLYSHYGSRGILLLTVLQNWSQGVEVWGREGMEKLNSAASHTVVGGNVKEADFLENQSKLIGDYEYMSYSSSTSAGGRTAQSSPQTEPILSGSDIRALPKGRAILLSPGVRPVLVRMNKWSDGPHADRMKEARRRREQLDQQRQKSLPVTDRVDDNPWLKGAA
jgi:type IV secretory pathway TraG/TraD family ATPase VirD4